MHTFDPSFTGFASLFLVRRGDAGLAAVVGDMAGYFLWPLKATPTAPMGSAIVTLVVSQGGTGPVNRVRARPFVEGTTQLISCLNAVAFKFQHD